jgi:SAM-dependent methyltransferase
MTKQMKLSIGLWDRLDPKTKSRLTRIRHPLWFGTLRNTQPVSAVWGKDRGTPLDRYYIERFLQLYSSDIHGKVLEVGGAAYTQKFGGSVARSDVLDNNPANPNATILGDLEATLKISSNEFDCLIFTQVLQFVYHLNDCIDELCRILKPGGVLLATVPSVSRIDVSYGPDKDFWRFTAASCEKLFGEVFGQGQASIQTFGNVFASTAFLNGAACEEVSPKELEVCDPLFPMLMGVRAVKR